MMKRVCGLVLICLAMGVSPVFADNDTDLDRIPTDTPPPPDVDAAKQGTPDARQRIFIEEDFTVTALRNNLLVPIPPPEPSSWQERFLFDARKEWALDDQVALIVSDRFNFRAENDLTFPSHQNVINEFREGYLSWKIIDGTYFDLGRLNEKSGVAVGFNPTDFFKTRTVIDPLTADPEVLREDRLGTVMLRAQEISEAGTITAVFAPALTRQTPVYTNQDLRSIDPSFDRTNATDRTLVKATPSIYQDFNPELLLYRESNRTSFGANMTEGLGQRIVAYAEWAGGDRSSLIDEALRFGRNTGTLPGAAPSVLPEDPRRHFQNDLSVGGSYATESKITINLEYHFHQAGFSNQDFNNFFSAGARNQRPIDDELTFIRAYALEQQEPLGTQSIFLRADWVDAFVTDLELTGFIDTDLYDGSSEFQINGQYYLSNSWTFGALAGAALGRRHSEFGSVPEVATYLVKLSRYF